MDYTRDDLSEALAFVRAELSFKATCEALEDWRLIPCGTYDRITEGGLRPTAVLRAGLQWLNDREGPTSMEAAFAQAKKESETTSHVKR